MNAQFENGYALVIGVDENSIPRWALPDVAKDVAAIRDVLTHPQRCAYPADHVKLLQGKDATRPGIIAGLRWLREQLQAAQDGNTTAVVYYSGHGWRNTATTPDTYYLIPYDVDEAMLASTALRAEDFSAGVTSLRPRRLLVILDACRSGGMGVKDPDAAQEPAAPPGYAQAALPVNLFLAPSSAAGGALGKDLSPLAQGAGRAVLSSSTGDQKSYMRIDGKMSIFTYHLIEALTGHAPVPDAATEVSVTEVMSYVARQVPVSAMNQAHARQQPVFELSGESWPVALLLGGKGLGKGVEPPDPLVPPAAAPRAAANVINTGGGAYVGGNVSVGRDFVGRDKIVHGDEVHGDKVAGDKVGGDKYSVGDISGSTGIAIGPGARADVRQGITGADLDRLFAPLVGLVQEQPPDKRSEAEQKVEQLKEEVAKGKSRDDPGMARLIQGLVDLVPAAVSTVVSMFATPILGGLVGPVTKFVLDGLKGR